MNKVWVVGETGVCQVEGCCIPELEQKLQIRTVNGRNFWETRQQAKTAHFIYQMEQCSERSRSKSKKTTVKQLIIDDLLYQISHNTAEGIHTMCCCPCCGKNGYRAGRTFACADCLTEYLKTMEENE